MKSALPDMPSEPFPDRWLLQNAQLNVHGRSSALDLHARGGREEFTDENGNHFVVLPSSLLEWDSERRP